MKPIQIKVLSYNIHKGFAFGNRKFVLSEIRGGIRLTQADLVFLQEVQGQNDDHAGQMENRPNTSQFEFLADQVWTHFAYGKNAVYTSGHHGNAILSKYPFSFSENLDVSMNRFESRGILHGILNLPNHSKPLHVICLHFGLFETDRKRQILKLCKRIESVVPSNDPLIVAGDFNDWREQATDTLRAQVGLEEVFLHLRGSHAKTFPAWLPAFRLDRIYFRNVVPVEAKCLEGEPWDSLSDHLALGAIFKV